MFLKEQRRVLCSWSSRSVLGSWIIQENDQIRYPCSQGASTSERNWSSKCSVWTTRRGRTRVRLAEQFSLLLQGRSDDGWRIGDWITCVQMHLGIRPFGVQTPWGSDPLEDWTIWTFVCILGIGPTGDWIPRGYAHIRSVHRYVFRFHIL